MAPSVSHGAEGQPVPSQAQSELFQQFRYIFGISNLNQFRGLHVRRSKASVKD